MEVFNPWVYPQIIQTESRPCSIETHGDLGIPHDLRNPHMTLAGHQLVYSTSRKGVIEASGNGKHPFRMEKSSINRYYIYIYMCMWEISVAMLDYQRITGWWF